MFFHFGGFIPVTWHCCQSRSLNTYMRTNEPSSENIQHFNVCQFTVTVLQSQACEASQAVKLSSVIVFSDLQSSMHRTGKSYNLKAALTSHFLCIFLWNNQRIYSQLLQQYKDPVHVCQETWSTFRPGRLMLQRSPRQRRSSVEGSVSRQQVHYQGYLLYGCNEHIL